MDHIVILDLSRSFILIDRCVGMAATSEACLAGLSDHSIPQAATRLTGHAAAWLPATISWQNITYQSRANTAE
jgi:hypothetical protein